MAKLQKIQQNEQKDEIIFLLTTSKKTFLIDEIEKVQFLPAPWFALHKVNRTQRTSFIINLCILTAITGVVTLLAGREFNVSPALAFYCLVLLFGLIVLFMSPKKSTRLYLESSQENLVLEDLNQNQISELYHLIKKRLISKIPGNSDIILESKVVRNKFFTISSFSISIIVLFILWKLNIGIIPMIILLFYCLLLCGSLAFNTNYNPKIQVYLAPNGLKFIEFQGKYAGQEHIIEADIIEKFTIDKSQVVGMIRKSRKSIITNSDSKEVLPHYNRKDLHFFHQAYLPVKEFRNIAPFFMDWLNDEIHKKNN